MTARTRFLPAVTGTLVLTLGLAACGGSSEPATSAAGTALLRAAERAGADADAVSFRQRTITRSRPDATGRADEEFARRGDDSLVATEYDDGGRLEVRRVGGVVYVRSDLRLATGARAPWLRIEPDADLGAWLGVLGSDVLAPTPGAVSDLLAADVDRVTGLGRGEAGARRLRVVPEEIADGERPTAILVRRAAPEFSGREATVFAGGEQVARRTYTDVRWGVRATAITVPDGAVSVDDVRDPQADALPAAIRRAPGALPDGWSLRTVVGITPSQGDGTCQQVLTLYAPTGRPLSAGYLALYLKAAGCPTPPAPGSARLTAGASTGWIGQDGAATIGALTVDGVSVRFRTTLGERDLARVLATWSPLPT